ncbi:MAG: hypothetical protein ACQEUB_12765, partial [Thermodesulfobacteriota bacterium]
KGLQPDANLYACEEKIEENIREVSGFSELISGPEPSPAHPRQAAQTPNTATLAIHTANIFIP